MVLAWLALIIPQVWAGEQSGQPYIEQTIYSSIHVYYALVVFWVWWSLIPFVNPVLLSVKDPLSIIANMQHVM